MTVFRLISKLALPVMTLAMFPIGMRAQPSGPDSKVVFASGGQASTFAFDFRKGMIFVPVRVNGSSPLSFVLDSGSTRVIVDRALAKNLGLKASGTGSLQGAGSGRIPIELIHDVRIALPGVEGTGYDLSTADLEPLEAWMEYSDTNSSADL